MNTEAPTPDTEILMAGERAFQAALSRARARGGPVREIDSLLARRSTAPALLDGTRLTRFTLGIQRLLQKRAAMPGEFQNTELLLFFTRGPQVAELFAQYDEDAQAWSSDEARDACEELLGEVDALLNEDTAGDVIAWINDELTAWHRLANGDSGSRSAGSGSAGSRVGWWLRALEDILARFGAQCPPGTDPVTWAVWTFPLNDYLALHEAALERAGCEVPDHYAVKEARAARKAAKAKAAAAKAAAAGRVKVCGVDCKPGEPTCNGYCEGKADAPPPADS